MKRLNERAGNGHPGYHNISIGAGSSTNNASESEAANHQDNLSHSLHQHFRRPSVGGSGNGSEILLDLLHCSPQHQQQQAANNAHVLYQHQGYQLLSAPSSSHPAQYPHAYNHYSFPAFAAAMAAGGHCASQMPTTPESTHNPFSTSAGSFNLQSIFSRSGTMANYNSPLTVGSSAIDGLASAALNDNATASLHPPVSIPDNAFCAVPADLKLRRNEKLENEENDNDNPREDIANILHAALKKESVIKKPKSEPMTLEDLDHNGDGGGTSSGFVTNPLSSAPIAARGPRRSGGNGGRGPRGSGTHGCPYCPKKFVDTQEAESHQDTCVRQRPFDCTHCGRRFRQKTSLVQHLRIHTDTRPYQCRFCVRNFKQKSHLDQHERIHTGAKPYLCKFCNKAFRQKSGQASHELTHANAMVQQFQIKHEESDGQREELSEEEEDDIDEDEGENDADDDEEPMQLRVAEDEAPHIRHSSSLSTDEVFDGNLKPIHRS